MPTFCSIYNGVALECVDVVEFCGCSHCWPIWEEQSALYLNTMVYNHLSKRPGPWLIPYPFISSGPQFATQVARRGGGGRSLLVHIGCVQPPREPSSISQKFNRDDNACSVMY